MRFSFAQGHPGSGMSPRSPTPLPVLCHPAEVSQAARVGSSPRSSLRPPSVPGTASGPSWCPVGVSLCEVIHRSGGRASSAPGPREQRVLCWQRWKERERGSLGKGGVYLDQCSLGPEGETGSSSLGENLVSGPMARFVNTTPERGVQPPAQEGEEFGNIWQH